MQEQTSSTAKPWVMKVAAIVIGFIGTFSSAYILWSNGNVTAQSVPLLLLFAAALAVAHNLGSYTPGVIYTLGPSLPTVVIISAFRTADNGTTYILVAAWFLFTAVGAVAGWQLSRKPRSFWTPELSARLVNGLAVAMTIMVLLRIFI
jgi:hypothetical protein